VVVAVAVDDDVAPCLVDAASLTAVAHYFYLGVVSHLVRLLVAALVDAVVGLCGVEPALALYRVDAASLSLAVHFYLHP